MACITDPLKQRSTFTSVYGWATYGRPQGIFVPWDLATVDFTEIMEKMRNHYSPIFSLNALWHAFHRRSQAPGESVTQFITALREAAQDCKFRELEDMLRDW